MKRFIKTTPDGVKDLLFEECKKRRIIENRINKTLRLRGYHEIITPALEYYDIFSFDTSYMPLQEMYKLTDLNGRLLVMRPDITVPIARVVATHLKEAKLPIKLCYNQEVFRITPNLSGRRDEITQCGAELIGVNGIKSDLEMISTAIAAIRSFCGDSFRFEIGHVDFFKTLIARLPLTDYEAADVHELIRVKNYAMLNDVLSPYRHLSAAQGLMRLPALFGGAEVLEEAKSFCGGDETISYLENIYNSMLELGLERHVIIDLGVIPQSPYYTGVVFRGYQEGLGMHVLSGGRYDRLLREFGRDLPAIGFAIYVDEAVESAMRKGNYEKVREYIIHAEKGCEIKALKYADSLREKDISCSFSVYKTLEESLNYARELGAHNLVTVGEEIKFLIEEGEDA